MDIRASVIVPNLNGAAVIGRCLQHLLAQTYANTEIIVVDDGSSDDSAEVAAGFAGRADLRVVRQPVTRGIAAARNLGVQHARGEAIAFIDTDGYAHPDWLAAAVRALSEDPSIGAVASTVFFDAHKLILNGAGGSLNYRGYAFDWGFETPYEFAVLPETVLYPMGCGAVVRRAVIDAIAPLDEAVTNYYDDVELGIRVWASGARVVVSRTAWVDHGFGGAEPNRPHQLLLGERHRIRTALKYFPAGHLAAWLAREWRLLDHMRVAGRRTIPSAAWAWNLRHLGSALAIRRRFAGNYRRFWPLLMPAWRLPNHPPTNRAFRPDPAAAGPRLMLDGRTDSAQLNFGWYPPEQDSAHPFRPAAAAASAFVRLAEPASECTLIWRGNAAVEEAVLTVRPLDASSQTRRIPLAPPPRTWEQRRVPCPLGPGSHELVLRTSPAWTDADNRERGVDVAAVQFGRRR